MVIRLKKLISDIVGSKIINANTIVDKIMMSMIFEYLYYKALMQILYILIMECMMLWIKLRLRIKLQLRARMSLNNMIYKNFYKISI